MNEIPLNFTEFEEPLPHWAIGRTSGKFVLGAQLFTKNSRAHGNAHILEIRPHEKLGEIFIVVTDMGNEIKLTERELARSFELGDYISSVAALSKMLGKHGQRPTPDSYCCSYSRHSNGWRHDPECGNYVVCY